MANQTTNMSRENIPLINRTRSRQTLAAIKAGTTEPVPDPERLLRRPQATRRAKSALPTLLTTDMTIYHTPKLDSPSDNEPNPFMDRPADRSGPSFPRVFDISRTSELPAMILEEPEEELNEDDSILITPLLDTNIKSTRPPPVSTTPPPHSPRNQRRMPSLPHMPMALSLSAPRWDGQAWSLRTYIRLVEQMLATTEITDEAQKLRWLTEYIDPDINNQWTSFEEYARGNWDNFLSRLRIEYPEITNEEQGSMDQLRWLCREITEIDRKSVV